MSFLTVAAATDKFAKDKGPTVRTGPELEIPGYGALDRHIGNFDVPIEIMSDWKLIVETKGATFAHFWEVLADTISDEVCKDMFIELGMGCRHRNIRYNCRVLCTYKRVLFTRPKMSLANDGPYREARHFTAWANPLQMETYYLEEVVEKATVLAWFWLAENIGARHLSVPIDQAVQASMAIINEALRFTPKYTVEGGTHSENLALQTSKHGLALLSWFSPVPPGLDLKERRETLPEMGDENLGPADLGGTPYRNPSAELLPLSTGVQDDESESEMGITYRTVYFWALAKSRETWSLIAEKVMRFFRNVRHIYAINRHMAKIITPSVHTSAYDPDDNRHDLRPFLYNVN
ncbi:NAD+ synthase (glutamine-hydrolyzing) [Apiospora marii]|uniref:NAD+ synthase (Glutamine-hydrolyzing) n=1 Tax=Apiospora marii TaxID=335849 RepID=A0ABR1SAG3_9PEZI